MPVYMICVEGRELRAPPLSLPNVITDLLNLYKRDMHSRVIRALRVVREVDQYSRGYVCVRTSSLPVAKPSENLNLDQIKSPLTYTSKVPFIRVRMGGQAGAGTCVSDAVGLDICMQP